MSHPNSIRYFEKENPDNSAEIYGEFLEPGDYETFQPDIYLGRWSLEYYKKLSWAIKNYWRAIWILNRYTVHGTEVWAQNIAVERQTQRNYRDVLETIKVLEKDPLAIWREMAPERYPILWKLYQTRTESSQD